MKFTTTGLLVPSSIALLLLFSGCATPYRLAIPDDVEVTSAEMQLGDDQDEIETEIVASNMTTAMGGGLLFAIADSAINNSRAKEASGAVGQIRNALIDFEFHDELKGALATSFKASSNISLTTLDLVTFTTEITNEKVLDSAKEQTVFAIVPYYSIGNEFRTAKVKLTVHLLSKDTAFSEALQRAKRAGATESVLFRNTYTANASLPIYEADLKINAPILAENEGRLLEKALLEAIKEVADMLAYDLSVGDFKALASASGGSEQMVVERGWTRYASGEIVTTFAFAE